MHVLFLTPAYPPFPGGGERYVRALATHLVNLGLSLTVLTSQARTEQDFWQGRGQQVLYQKDGQVEVIRTPLRPFPGGRPALMGWRKLMVLISLLPGRQTGKLLRMARLIPPMPLEAALQDLPQTFDIVHGFNISWEYPLVSGWLFARQLDLPFVTTPFMHFGTGHDRVARNSTMDHQRELLMAASRVFALTIIEKTGLEKLGVLKNQVVVTGAALDPLPPKGDNASLLHQHRLKKPYVVFVGRTSYEKGAIHAAKAILTLSAQNIDAQLVLIGHTTPDFLQYFSCLTLSEQEKIRPLGILSEVDKHTLLSGAALLVLPSRTDSFGIVLLEAWAHGVPVVAALAGGIPGVVDDGQNGLLVPFGDLPALTKVLAHLLENTSLQRKLGDNGRAKVTAVYTWPQVAARVHQQYTRLFST